jgi:hypothetical protein
MRRDLSRRLADLERVYRPAGCTVIRLQGGLPFLPGHASAGTLRFRQAPDETREAFEARAVATADAAGEPLLVIGGLPDPPSDDAPRLLWSS